MRRRSKDPRGRMCRCGHERDYHVQIFTADKITRGRCEYGEGHVMGGCSCTHYHTTSERGPTTMPTPRKIDTDPRTIYGIALADLRESVAQAIAMFDRKVRPLLGEVGIVRPLSRATIAQVARQERDRPPVPAPAREGSAGPLSPCAREILATLAQWSLVRSSLSLSFVSIFAGYSPRSGGVAKALAQLRAGGFIEGSASALAITEHGRRIADKRAAIPRGSKMREQLLAMWTAKLDPCSALILTYLEERAPESASAAEIAEATRYSARSGGMAKAYAKLRRLDLIKGTSKSMTIHDAFGT